MKATSQVSTSSATSAHHTKYVPTFWFLKVNKQSRIFYHDEKCQVIVPERHSIILRYLIIFIIFLCFLPCAQVYCDMTGPGVSLGGDGSTLTTASVSCANIKANFGKTANGYYWLNMTGTPAQYICAMSISAGTVMYDGSSTANAATSCEQIIQWYTNRTSGTFYLQGTGLVYCDFTISPRKNPVLGCCSEGATIWSGIVGGLWPSNELRAMWMISIFARCGMFRLGFHSL